MRNFIKIHNLIFQISDFSTTTTRSPLPSPQQHLKKTPKLFTNFGSQDIFSAKKAPEQFTNSESEDIFSVKKTPEQLTNFESQDIFSGEHNDNVSKSGLFHCKHYYFYYIVQRF